jgi:hypothetical protein
MKAAHRPKIDVKSVLPPFKPAYLHLSDIKPVHPSPAYSNAGWIAGRQTDRQTGVPASRYKWKRQFFIALVSRRG